MSAARMLVVLARAAPAVMALAMAATGCGSDSDSARQAVTRAVQKAVPAARAKAWHGTLTVHTTAGGAFPDESNSIISTAEHAVTLEITANLVVNGAAEASLDYSETTQTNFHSDYDAYTITGSQLQTIAASGPSPEARVSIDLYQDGSYTIDYFARGIDGQGTVTGGSSLRCKPGKDPECVDKNDPIDGTWTANDLASVSGLVNGRIDKNNRYVLTGSHTEPYEMNSGATGRTVVSWDLRR